MPTPCLLVPSNGQSIARTDSITIVIQVSDCKQQYRIHMYSVRDLSTEVPGSPFSLTSSCRNGTRTNDGIALALAVPMNYPPGDYLLEIENVGTGDIFTGGVFTII